MHRADGGCHGRCVPSKSSSSPRCAGSSSLRASFYHKTVMGFGFGVLAAVVVTFVQSRVAWEGALVSYDHWTALGLRFGFGAMAGDSAKSFLKRRAGIARGRPWIR